MWYDPLCSLVVGEQLGACQEKQFPSLIPTFFVSFAVASCEQLHYFCTMIVKLLEPILTSLRIMAPINFPSRDLGQRWLNLSWKVVARHHASTKEMLTHPIWGVSDLESVCVGFMSEDVHEEETFWFQPRGYSSEKLTPVSHVLKHLHRDDSIKSYCLRLECIHVCNWCFYVL